jgi:hypothetical protein
LLKKNKTKIKNNKMKEWDEEWEDEIEDLGEIEMKLCKPPVDDNFKFLASGSYGNIYQDAISKEIYKYQEYSIPGEVWKIRYEYHMMYKFWKACIGPKPLDKIENTDDDGNGCVLIIMEPIKLTLAQYITDCIFNVDIDLPYQLKKCLDAIMNLTYILCKYNLIHGDLHFGNLGLQSVEYWNQKCGDHVEFLDDIHGADITQYRLVCIDFGEASDNIQCLTKYEILNLFRFLNNIRFMVDDELLRRNNDNDDRIYRSRGQFVVTYFSKEFSKILDELNLPNINDYNMAENLFERYQKQYDVIHSKKILRLKFELK